MVALVRYQAAILLRSHRWISPLIAYGLLVSAAAATGAPLFLAGPAQLVAKSIQLAQGLAWSAAMLVPIVAFLTRSMLTAEPSAARACVAAAAGPVRAQLAALLTAIGGGAILGIAGACLTVLVGGFAATARAHPGIFVADLASATVCLLVGSAVGALCNPPLLRHPGVAVLATLALIVFALASNLSPAATVLRSSTTAQVADAHWPGGAPLLTAAALLAVTWSASVYAGARRG